MYGKEHVLSVSGEYGVINQIELLGRSYAGVSVLDYHVVDTGDIVYTKSPLKTNPYGIIKANLGPSGIVSTLYAVYKVSPEHSSKYWNAYFCLDDRTNKYLLPLVHKGAKNDMKINNDRVLIDPVSSPTLPEQRKIAEFLEAVDERIAQVTRKKALLEDYKKGCMQQLFSQSIRFKDDQGNDFPDWVSKPFGKIASRSKDKFDPRKDGSSPKLIELENIEAGTGRIVGVSSLEGQRSLKNCFKEGDVLFSKLRPYLKKYARPDFDGVCTSEIWVLQSTDLQTLFLFYLVQSEQFMQLANLSSGSKMPRAEWKVISDSDFELPHPDEQQKIADFLSAIDTKIDLVTQELEQAKTFKKGLLQQMFV